MTSADGAHHRGPLPQPRRGDHRAAARSAALNLMFQHLHFAVRHQLRYPTQVVVAAEADPDKIKSHDSISVPGLSRILLSTRLL